MAKTKTAIVTGSGKKRVGNVVARWLAQHGYDLAIHYRTSADEAAQTAGEIESLGRRALLVQADLGSESEVLRMVDQVVAEFTTIDLLVNTAAIWVPKRLEEVSAADVRQHFDVNTLGTFLCARAVGLIMCQQAGGGSIVNIGDWAIERPYVNYAAYFPSKGAIPTLTRSLAVEFGVRNPHVRVNCILPGPVMLPPDMSREEREAVTRATLAKREGKPDDVARAVLFFAESDFVTGECLAVDGGRTIYAGPDDARSGEIE